MTLILQIMIGVALGIVIGLPIQKKVASKTWEEHKEDLSYSFSILFLMLLFFAPLIGILIYYGLDLDITQSQKKNEIWIQTGIGFLINYCIFFGPETIDWLKEKCLLISKRSERHY